MASELTFYSKFKQHLLDGVINLNTDTIKVMLVTDAYTFDASDESLSDVQTSPDPEVVAVASPSNGYTAGGETLGTPHITTHSDAPNQAAWDAPNLTWAALTATFRGGVIYASGSVGGFTDPLIGYILFDTTPADVVVSGVDYTIQWSANGILTLA
jgi:hypothetical protein